LRIANNGVPWKVQLLERLEAENARAVNWRAYNVVLFEDGNAEPACRELPRRDQARRTAANHHHVTIRSTSIGG
jgi:hypothetical protein